MSRVAILLALLIGTVLVAFLVLIAVSELATWRRGATTGWVFIARDGRIAISGPFEEVQPFRGGLAAVKKGGQWGFIDATGREVLPFRFASVGSFSPEGLAPATGAGGWGYIRRDGNWAISPRYDRADEFVEGRALVRMVVGSRSGRSYSPIHSYTLIDPTGREVAPVRAWNDPARLTLYRVAEGLAAVQIGVDNRFGWVDRELKLAIPPRFSNVMPFSEGLAPAEEGGLWGFVDKTGRFAIPPAFSSAEPFREGLAVAGNERYGFLRPDGSPAFEATFEWARSFSGGFAAVRTAAGWGFIDRTGRIVVEPAYVDVGGGLHDHAGFSEERAAVAVPSGNLDRRWGFVDTAGRLVIPTTFLEVDPAGFSEGLCAVRVSR